MGIDYSKRPSASNPPAAIPPAATPPAAGPPASGPPSYTKAPAAPAPAAGSTGGGGVSLGKVTLTKSAPAVSLTKGGAGGTLRVNLNWTARPVDTTKQATPEKKGFLKKLQAAAEAKMSSGAIDLDLGALYEYSDGSKGVVQALGNAFRDQHTLGANPICWLDGDDRSGSVSGGENLFVDLNQTASIRRILVFAFIYQGVPNWAAADAVVTLFPVQGPQIEIRLDQADNQAPMCAIAMLTNDGSGMAVNHEVQYIRGGQSHLDKAYGWGMQWARGSK